MICMKVLVQIATLAKLAGPKSCCEHHASMELLTEAAIGRA